MGVLSSRPEKRLSRNSLLPHEQAVVDRYRAMVVRELRQWISATDLALIKSGPRYSPEIFLLSMAVRNEYELWLPEHEVTSIWHQCELEFPLTTDVDDHPCHPDNFSASCVFALWDQLQ